MPSGSIYTYVANANPSDGTNQIVTSQGTVPLGGYGYFLPDEVVIAESKGLILEAGIVGPAQPGSTGPRLVSTLKSTSGTVPVADGNGGYTWEAGGGAAALEVTDGITTVADTTEIDFTSGLVVTSGGTGVAEVALSSSVVTDVSSPAAVLKSEGATGGQALVYNGTDEQWEPGTVSTTPNVVEAGNLGGAYSLTVTAANDTWLVGTLNANCALTLTDLASGAGFKLLLTQDGTGGRTLTVDSVSVPVPSAADASMIVDGYYDGTNVYLAVEGTISGMSNPMTAGNDLIIGGSSGTPTRLATVDSSYLQTDGSGNVEWGAAPSGGVPLDFGTAAARPLATAGVAIYYATDSEEASFSDGTAWHDIAGFSQEVSFNNASNGMKLAAGAYLFFDFAYGIGLKSASHNALQLGAASLDITSAGKGLMVAEGSNAKQGTATLVAGTVTVANSSVTATSRIFLTAQDNNTTGALRVSARTAGASFTITSSNNGDTGVVAFEIFEVG